MVSEVPVELALGEDWDAITLGESALTTHGLIIPVKLVVVTMEILVSVVTTDCTVLVCTVTEVCTETVDCMVVSETVDCMVVSVDTGVTIATGDVDFKPMFLEHSTSNDDAKPTAKLLNYKYYLSYLSISKIDNYFILIVEYILHLYLKFVDFVFYQKSRIENHILVQ
jgi:hypothetical protein